MIAVGLAPRVALPARSAAPPPAAAPALAFAKGGCAAPLAPPADGYDRPHDKDWLDAGQLLASHGIPAQDHQLMQENLATYLAHRTLGIPSERWQHKLDRELAQPYTDEQVLQHVDELQASLVENIQALPAYPSKIYLTGSFSRGRLGHNSDLDGYGVLKPQDLTAGFDSYEQRDSNDSGANLFPFSESRPGYNQAMLMVAGSSLTVQPEQLFKPGFLKQTYQSLLAHKGPGRRETNPVYEWAAGNIWKEGLTPAQKREQFEGKTLSSRLWGYSLSLGGSLSMVPVVGPVVRKAADLMVRQSHLDYTQGPPTPSVRPNPVESTLP